ncbi:NUDIX domain-containing protein [Candidatus Bealeia paramacronuclearis]|uniref:NUDIX domain-containing protein n=1 Tax=Candidatus Bealeia paramacronuclearis TaxID=1921001 RepID=UPI003BAE6BE2
MPTTDWDLTLPKRLLQDISLPEHLNLRGEVNHTFTHFHLNLKVWEGATRHLNQGEWVDFENLKDYALPTLMKKVLSL